MSPSKTSGARWVSGIHQSSLIANADREDPKSLKIGSPVSSSMEIECPRDACTGYPSTSTGIFGVDSSASSILRNMESSMTSIRTFWAVISAWCKSSILDVMRYCCNCKVTYLYVSSHSRRTASLHIRGDAAQHGQRFPLALCPPGTCSAGSIDYILGALMRCSSDRSLGRHPRPAVYILSQDAPLDGCSNV